MTGKHEVLNLLTAGKLEGRRTITLADVFTRRLAGQRVRFGVYCELMVRELDPFAIMVTLESPDGAEATLSEQVIYPTSSVVQLALADLWDNIMRGGGHAVHFHVNGRLLRSRVIQVNAGEYQ